MKVEKLQSANYNERTDIIEPIGEIIEVDDLGEEDRDLTYYDIIHDRLLGWGDFTHLLRVKEAGGVFLAVVV